MLLIRRVSNAMWEGYCNDYLIDDFPSREAAEKWLERMESADIDQEFTWSIRRVDDPPHTAGQRGGE